MGLKLSMGDMCKARPRDITFEDIYIDTFRHLSSTIIPLLDSSIVMEEQLRLYEVILYDKWIEVRHEVI